MAFQFPINPTNNQVVQNLDAGKQYIFTSGSWKMQSFLTEMLPVVSSSYSVTSSYVLPSQKSWELRKSEYTTGSNVAAKINWDNTDSNNIADVTLSNGVFTNTGAATKTLVFNYQNSIAATTITLYDIWFQKNAPNGDTNTSRYGLVGGYLNSNTGVTANTSWTFTLLPNETITCWAYVTATGTLTLGGTLFGMAGNYSTRLTITEIR